MVDYWMKQGAALPTITGTPRDGSGKIAIFPNGSTVQIVIWSDLNEGLTLIEQSASFVAATDPVAGAYQQLSYTLQAADLLALVPGRSYYADFKVTMPGGTVARFPTPESLVLGYVPAPG